MNRRRFECLLYGLLDTILRQNINSPFEDTLATYRAVLDLRQIRLQYVWNVTNQGCFSTGSAKRSFTLQCKMVHSVPPGIYIHR